VIRAEGLSKRYRIGQRKPYGTLRDTLTDAMYAPFRALATVGRRFKTGDGRQPAAGSGEPSLAVGGQRSPVESHIWALKDVSFEVNQGEVVGIIGRNGAGKSTLLKVLSRITEPTEGYAEIHGRIGSLLEVGTGFHPELTGRENIYLNGAILGMKKGEIDRKFDEIVSFAEVETFIDTPVKHYSSGMYVRLAFAVAAHLEPEILVVDEVLAVGDTEFQKKCLGKMKEVSKEGRTVLFVSHNMAAVQQLCQGGMVLSHGQISFLGDAQGAIGHYIQNAKVSQPLCLADRKDRQGSQWLTFTKVALFDAAGNELVQVLSGQDVFVRFYYVSLKSLQNAKVNIAFNVRSNQGYLFTNLNSVDAGNEILDVYPSGFFRCAWPNFNLRSGSYDCALFCAINGEVVDWLQSAFTIEVEDGDFFNTGKLISREAGDILISHCWSSQPNSPQ